jgi:DNA-binding MarR family transcriptional regulator
MAKLYNQQSLGSLILIFMAEMHRYDGGRTLPVLHASKLTTPQLAVLDFVRTPCTVSAVADYVSLSRPATSQMVEKLVRHGLVRRNLSLVDRREKSVTLSAKGDLLLRGIAKARVARFDASLSALPIPLAERLSLVLADVVDALGPAQESRPKTHAAAERAR